MLQFCYNRRCNPSITLLKHVCNIQPVLLHHHKQQMIMEKEKAEKIIKCSNWLRFFIFAAFVTIVFMGLL